MIQPTLVKLDRQQKTYHNLSFVKGDLARLQFEVTDNGVPITEYTSVNIEVKRNGIARLFHCNVNNGISYQFKGEIKEPGKYECRLALRNGSDTVHSKEFEIYFSPDWIVENHDQEENINIIDDIYNKILEVKDIAESGFNSGTLDNKTGKLTLSNVKGQKVIFDFPTEWIFDSGYFDEETQNLVVVLANGTEVKIPLNDIYKKIGDEVNDIQFTLADYLLRIEELELNNEAILINLDEINPIITNHEERINLLETDNTLNKNEIDQIKNTINNDVLTKDKATVSDDYLVDGPNTLVPQRYVEDLLGDATGINLDVILHRDEFNSFKQDLLKPDFIDLELDQPINYIEDAILDSPQEIEEIIGKSEVIISDTGMAHVENPIVESVGKNLLPNELSRHDVKWTSIKLERNKTYTFSLESVTDATSWRYGIRCFNNGEDVTSIIPINITSYHVYYHTIIKALWGSSDIVIKTFTINTVGFDEIHLAIHSGTTKLESKTIKAMLNEGSTPLPYEPYINHKQQFQETLKGIPNTNIADRLVNENGVYKYYGDVGSKVIELNDIALTTGTSNVDYIRVTKPLDYIGYGNYTNYNNSVNVEGFINDGLGTYDNINSVGKILTNQSNTQFYLGIEKGSHTLESARELLRGKTLLYQKAETEVRDAVVIQKEDLDFSKGNTIYLKSDSNVYPTVKARCAMDLSAQVNKLTEKDRINNAKHNEQDSKIKALESEIAELKQMINNITTSE